jgi:hypothetical protein
MRWFALVFFFVLLGRSCAPANPSQDGARLAAIEAALDQEIAATQDALNRANAGEL